jgi:hypothetical protein
MKKILLPVVFFYFLLFINAYATPELALRLGNAACISCHVNPTGGDMRNMGGWAFGKTVLPMFSPRDESLKMSNQIGDNIFFGFDYRIQYLAGTFGKSTRTDFQRMNGSIYTDVQFSSKIDAFARYDFVWKIWEAYATAHILPNNSYIKVGAYSPNFGIRLDDHTAYTRGGDLGLLTGRIQGLIYEPRYTETGIELGYYFSSWGFLTASAGNSLSGFDRNYPYPLEFMKDPTYTANLKISPHIVNGVNLYLGGSFADFKYSPLYGPPYHDVNMYGPYLGIGIGDFILMGEYDMAKDYLMVGSKSSALMVEGVYNLIRGLDAYVRYDRFDPNLDAKKDDVSRFVLGLEFFPYSFVEIRPMYRIQMETPSVANNSFEFQFHFYY